MMIVVVVRLRGLHQHYCVCFKVAVVKADSEVFARRRCLSVFVVPFAVFVLPEFHHIFHNPANASCSRHPKSNHVITSKMPSTITKA
jgi:hypothetical protein